VYWLCAFSLNTIIMSRVNACYRENSISKMLTAHNLKAARVFFSIFFYLSRFCFTLIFHADARHLLSSFYWLFPVPRIVNYIDYASDSDSTIAIFFLFRGVSRIRNNLADGWQLTEHYWIMFWPRLLASWRFAVRWENEWATLDRSTEMSSSALN
jgi:hypothetical protein